MSETTDKKPETPAVAPVAPVKASAPADGPRLAYIGGKHVGKVGIGTTTITLDENGVSEEIVTQEQIDAVVGKCPGWVVADPPAPKSKKA